MTGLGTGISSNAAPAGAFIAARVEAQAVQTPEAIAVRFGDADVAYAELVDRVRLAATGLAAAGVEAGEPVALLLPRGLEQLIAMLAIARIGGCYLPLDPEAPPARLTHMLDETGTAWIVGDPIAAAALCTASRRCLAPQALQRTGLDAAPAPLAPLTADDRFCILYTSGSTGVPKGVELTQLNVLNCLDWMQHEYRLGAADRVLHKTPTTFDVSMYELFWPLMAGATVVMAEPQGHRDAGYLAELIEREGVTAAHFVPSMLAAFLEEPEARRCTSLRQVFAAGEALPYPLTQRFYERLPDACLHNLYGPTEAGVVSAWTCPIEQAQRRVPIGKAVANTQLYVLDEHLRMVPAGDEGELYIGGLQLARGYVARADLTAQRFIEHPLLGRLYRTGDLVRELDGGVYDYLGRRDHQVKLRGVRIELGEIETRLAEHDGVIEAVAGVRDVAPGDTRLIAWYQPRSGAAPALDSLRAHLAQRLPDAMLPQHFIALEALPHLPNGKIDRKALPGPALDRRANALASSTARNPLQTRLLSIWRSVLGLADIGLDDRFFEIGGSSLLALRVMAQLREALGVRVPLTRFFAAPSVAAFGEMLERDYSSEVAAWLGQSAPPLAGAEPGTTAAPLTQRRPAAESAAPAASRHDQAHEPIAIVGMACRVPGADDLEQFWDAIANGREGLRDLTDDELTAAGVSAEERADAAYVRRAGPMRDGYCFDAAFFGYSPREAELTDPQQRVLLECAWHALEHAGIVPAGRRIGVYVGIAHNHYFDRSLATYDDLRLGQDGFQTLLGSDKDYAATRIAYKLDLRGPALSLQTACSTSGVALHLAVQALRNGDCEAAIVGGARVNVPDTAGYAHIDGGPQAVDGKVRPFDASASGMVLGSGVACLVLKPLSRALADGERIYATIRGTAINNDGAIKAGYTAPSEDGQVAVIQAALAAAGVEADSIGFVEAHGTGTALGDPIEVAALARAYANADRIALGSVKANIGHLDAAAGAIGAIKAALALDRKQLPPTIHFERANPECDFDNTPFFVNTELQPWPADAPRRAALSSFGFGGTNFHGVLEQAPEQAPEQASAPSARPYALLRLSAKTDAALHEQAQRLAAALRADPSMNLADVAYTLDVGRTRLERRASVVACDVQQAIERLAQVDAGSPDARPSLVLMFPGQGAQHVNMGRELYQREPLFRELVDRCASHLKPALGRDLREVLYPHSADDTEACAALLRTTEYAQPAIFTISYATARLWQSWGLQPDAMVGHSLGEFVAATLAGVFELEHALDIIAERGRMMQSMPRGGMLAVRLSEADAQPYLIDGVTLGGVNSPGLVVLSGPNEALAKVEAQLSARDIGFSPLHTSHAFHSPMMDPLVEPFAAVVERYPRGAASLPLVSTLSGGWAGEHDLQEPYHWARQLREPVRFGPAVQTLLQTPGRVFLEVGPGQNLSTAVRQALRPEHRATALASLPHAGQDGVPALEHLLGAAGRLFAAGIELDAARFYAGERRLKLGLPGYPFARTRHFIEPAATSGVSSAMTAAVANDAAAAASNAALEQSAVENPVRTRLVALLARLTGTSFTADQDERCFLELGLDSLTLTQVAGKLKTEFKVELRFRQLLEEYSSIATLTAYLQQHGKQAADNVVVPLRGHAGVPAEAPQQAAAATFGAGARITRQNNGELSRRQEQALAALSQRYLARTGKSKAFAQGNRAHLADPRTVSGFRPLIKELVYPIVVDRSEGAYLWDLDGNRYVDATCGFGSMFFGHKPAFVAEAMSAQMQQGWEIGPQHPLAGECAALFTQATGLERVAFCNTGSEAVIAAVRLARTVTGKNLIVSFSGDYHGIQDEVIVRGAANHRSVPAAPGIPDESVANTLILDYGAPESLEIIRQRADEIAGILIEPVQSRRPDFQPRDFLQQLRALTADADIAFIMDEVITGFRSGLQGAQAFYGVKADIGVYGKVFGGGMPIGAVAGIPRFMDALDGGHWQYGDDSIPEVGVTYFAGTFVRHPLTLAAVRASLKALLARPDWPSEVAEKTRQMTDIINADLHAAGAPLHIARFASLWKPKYDEDRPHGDLLFFYLRERGIHIWDGRPCFLSAAHSDADVQQIIDAFRYAIAQMKAGGFFDAPGAVEPVAAARSAYTPPQPGARVGRDANGAPAWFIPDPQRPGRYLQLPHELEHAA